MPANPSTARAGRAVHASRTLSAAASVLALAVSLAACSSTPSHPAAAPPTTAVRPATAEAGAQHAYATLFDMANKAVAPKLAVIEDGSTLRTAISQALSSSLAASAAGAKVVGITLLSTSGCANAGLPAPCARVSYDILGTSGKPLLSSASVGYSVDVNGTWLVAKSTICGLLSMFEAASGSKSSTPPGCP
ncbi:MAG: hypothetical protein ACYCUF_07805 [Acidimicrobiales bacterium]